MSEEYPNKFDYLDRAKALMAAGDAASLRYACLELRFCIEAVTYDKLGAYARRLPPGVLSIWQPPQAMKALRELEGEADADDEYVVAIGRTGSGQPMQVMGEHRTFTTKWLRDHYHKLGFYLHASNRNAPGQSQGQVDPQQLRPYLVSVVEECERVVESSVTLTLAPTVEYKCQLCGRKTLANAEGATRRGRVSCLHERCEAEHLVSVREDQRLYLELSGWWFLCLACEHQILVPSKHLLPGYEFTCNECGRKHKLVDQVWRYTML